MMARLYLKIKKFRKVSHNLYIEYSSLPSVVRLTPFTITHGLSDWIPIVMYVG